MRPTKILDIWGTLKQQMTRFPEIPWIWPWTHLARAFPRSSQVKRIFQAFAPPLTYHRSCTDGGMANLRGQTPETFLRRDCLRTATQSSSCQMRSREAISSNILNFMLRRREWKLH